LPATTSARTLPLFLLIGLGLVRLTADGISRARLDGFVRLLEPRVAVQYSDERLRFGRRLDVGEQNFLTVQSATVERLVLVGVVANRCTAQRDPGKESFGARPRQYF